MSETHTPGASRALGRAALRAAQAGRAEVGPLDLLVALADDEECRAAALLGVHGLAPGRVAGLLGAEALEPGSLVPEGDGPALPHDEALRQVEAEATYQARRLERSRAVGTEHLLGAMLSLEMEAAQRLVAAGLDREGLLGELDEETRVDEEPLPMPGDIPPLELEDPAESVALARILDASANRAGEGLRVVEDYIRFVLDDPGLTRRVKDVRHRFGEAARGLDLEMRLAARDTSGDVGTHITTPTERVRENARAILAANFRRTAEALRSLEEYTKRDDAWLSSRFEVLRYDVYTLEKQVLTAVQSARALGDTRLCFLVGGQGVLGELRWLVGEALAGGVQMVQLREKGLEDREILARAAEVRKLTREAGAWFIMNDRPDLARLAGADGVHLGQGDVPAALARKVVGPRALVGVSTHDGVQIEEAARGGASYLGVGPVGPSRTKAFEAFAGLELVGVAAEVTALPWFAIGGIDLESLPGVLEAGARRVAVGSAISQAERPREAAAALRAELDGVWG